MSVLAKDPYARAALATMAFALAAGTLGGRGVNRQSIMYNGLLLAQGLMVGIWSTVLLHITLSACCMFFPKATSVLM